MSNPMMLFVEYRTRNKEAEIQVKNSLCSLSNNLVSPEDPRCGVVTYICAKEIEKEEIDDSEPRSI